MVPIRAENSVGAIGAVVGAKSLKNPCSTHPRPIRGILDRPGFQKAPEAGAADSQSGLAVGTLTGFFSKR
jgi:hypothetical protein